MARLERPVDAALTLLPCGLIGRPSAAGTTTWLWGAWHSTAAEQESEEGYPDVNSSWSKS